VEIALVAANSRSHPRAASHYREHYADHHASTPGARHVSPPRCSAARLFARTVPSRRPVKSRS
jgi:hypothetical protein